MKLVHLTSTADGGSRFAEMKIHLDASPTPSGSVVSRSDVFPLVGSMIMELPEGLAMDWHTSPRPSFVVVLSGMVQSETSDGTKHNWGAGEMFVTDDRDGRGHRTRTVDGPARLLFLYTERLTVSRFSRSFDEARPSSAATASHGTGSAFDGWLLLADRDDSDAGAITVTARRPSYHHDQMVHRKSRVSPWIEKLVVALSV